MQPSDSTPPANVINMPLLPQRALLIPLRPKDESARAALPGILQALHEKAAADQHPVLAPTHLMLKGDEIIGYLSLGALPMVQAWFDSQHKHPGDSLKMIEHGETIFREQGVQMYGLCCAAESPFTPHLERLGFRKLGTTVVWVKEL